MKLSAYLEKKQMRPSALADVIGVPASTITRIVKGERTPGVELISKIEAATDGAVSYEDFLPFRGDQEIPSPQAPAPIEGDNGQAIARAR